MKMKKLGIYSSDRTSILSERSFRLRIKEWYAKQLLDELRHADTSAKMIGKKSN